MGGGGGGGGGETRKRREEGPRHARGRNAKKVRAGATVFPHARSSTHARTYLPSSASPRRWAPGPRPPAWRSPSPAQRAWRRRSRRRRRRRPPCQTLPAHTHVLVRLIIGRSTLPPPPTHAPTSSSSRKASAASSFSHSGTSPAAGKYVARVSRSAADSLMSDPPPPTLLTRCVWVGHPFVGDTVNWSPRACMHACICKPTEYQTFTLERSSASIAALDIFPFPSCHVRAPFLLPPSPWH